MNKIFKSIVFVLAMFAILVGCKKDEVAPIKKVETESYSYGSFCKYEYGVDGKLVKKIWSSNDYVSYTYTGSTVNESVYNDHNDHNGIIKLDTIHVYQVNAQGYYSGETNYFSSDTIFTTYTYDNAGYLTVSKTTEKNKHSLKITTDSAFYLNGNMISEKRTRTTTKYKTLYEPQSVSVNEDITTYQYYLDKVNSISDERKGITMYGKSSRNLIKQILSTQSSLVSYVYEFDSDGNVAKQTSIGESSVSWTAYTYK